MVVTLIDDRNAEHFKNLISKRIWLSLDEPDILALGAVTDESDGEAGIAVGALVAEVGEESADINWLYVASEYRGRGAGSALVNALLGAAKNDGLVEELFMFFPDEPEYRDMVAFLDEKSFELEPVSKCGLYSIKVGKLTGNKLWQKPGIGSGAMFFKALPDIYLDIFNRTARNRHGLVEFPLDKNKFLPCSMAYVRDSDVRGLMLFSKKEAGKGAALVYAWVRRGERNAIPAMLSGAAKAISRLYPPDTEIVFATVNEVSRTIATALDPAVESMGVLVARLPVVE